jgi:hypothetical protein
VVDRRPGDARGGEDTRRPVVGLTIGIALRMRFEFV